MDKIALYNICRIAVDERDEFECLVIHLKSGQIFSGIGILEMHDYCQNVEFSEEKEIGDLLIPDSTFIVRSKDLITFISVDEIEYVNLIYKNDD